MLALRRAPTPLLRLLHRPKYQTSILQSRYVHIRATPSTQHLEGVVDLSDQTQAIPKLSANGPFPAEVQFEVLGAPYSLLSVALPASSTLFSQRGTLIGLNGSVENATSSLSILEPIRRTLLGIPFLYQRTTSTSPLTLLLSTNSSNTTFGVLNLDGKADWQICQRNALLAWAGHSLSIQPTFSPRMGLAHWGSSKVTGRGLVALIGKGQIYQATLKPGESFVVHPSSLLAYAVANYQKKPTPYRVAAGAHQLRLQIPGVVRSWWQGLDGVKSVRGSEAWGKMSETVWRVRQWVRRTVMGDRLFLKFDGPATILIQSRTANLRDLLTNEDVDELASVQPSRTSNSILSALAPSSAPATPVMPPSMSGTTPAAPISSPLNKFPNTPKEAHIKDLGRDVVEKTRVTRRVMIKNGKAEFVDSDFKEFIR